MKKCFKCDKQKPLKEFYRHAQMADGRLNKCKDCTKKDVSKTRKEHIKTDPSWVESERERCREKMRIARLNGTAKESSNEVKNGWRKRNREKATASQIARRAIITGKLKKKSACELCGASDVRLEMHHQDYKRPLSVVTMCCSCHGKTKRKLSKS